MTTTNSPLPPSIKMAGYAHDMGEKIGISFNSECQIVDTDYPKWSPEYTNDKREIAGRIQHLIGIYVAIAALTGNNDNMSEISYQADKVVMANRVTRRYCRPCDAVQDVAQEPTGPECSVCGSEI